MTKSMSKILNCTKDIIPTGRYITLERANGPYMTHTPLVRDLQYERALQSNNGLLTYVVCIFLNYVI